MEQVFRDQPWMGLLRSNPEHLANFNAWIGSRITSLGIQALEASELHTLYGLKFLASELEALRVRINEPLIEAQTLAELEELQHGGIPGDSTGRDIGLYS